MNKSELIDRIASEMNIPKAKASKAVDAILNGMRSAFENGEEVRFSGFGSFAVSELAAREGRNPQTGVRLKIPARKVVRFKPGKGIKSVLNGD